MNIPTYLTFPEGSPARTPALIDVRYAETDQMGIAHHSVYAVWFEQARTELIARLGWHYRDLEQAGLLLPLAELSARYYKPAFYEDRLLIYTHVSKLTAAQLEFSYEVVRDGELIAAGTTRHGCTGKDLRPINIKKKFPDVYAAMQALSLRDECQ